MRALNERLKVDFCLDPLPLYTIVTEGWTDVHYLLRAVELAKEETGIDLLHAGDAEDGQPVRISIVTPGKRGNATVGGVPQMVRLAEAVREACFLYEAYCGLAFLFDHDDAGMKAGRDVLEGHGFRVGRYTLTLDPKEHPGACASKQVVIEDLLSLSIQGAFFSQGTAWCSAEYRAGALQRYVWGHQSKGSLQEYVLAHAKWSDLREIGRVVKRVRDMWGLSTSGWLFDAGASAQPVTAIDASHRG